MTSQTNGLPTSGLPTSGLPISGLPISGLPMYDWPEVRQATDALWQQIQSELAVVGVEAPGSLWRAGSTSSSSNAAPLGTETGGTSAANDGQHQPLDLNEFWCSPSLLIGQTCGLPLVTHLRDHAHVLGSFAFDYPDQYGIDAGSGEYCSVLVVRADDAQATTVSSLRGRNVGFNEVGSQSGNAALRHLVAPLANGQKFFATAVASGSHRESVRLVASGVVDVAALDATSWLLALDHEPAAKGLRVLTTTPPTPGLPLITSVTNAANAPMLRTVLATAVRKLDGAHRRSLHLTGFRPSSDTGYEIIARRYDECATLRYPSLP